LELASHGPRGRTRPRGLASRFAADRTRTQLHALERATHARLALGNSELGDAQALTDFEHFERALPTGVGTVVKTLLATAVLVVANIIGRFIPTTPQVPLARGSPAGGVELGKLTRVLELDVTHLGAVVDQLSHTSATNLAALLATIAAAAFIVLRPGAHAYHRMRRAVSRLDLRQREYETFARMGASAPAEGTFDLAVKATLGLTAVALGASWALAYQRGFAITVSGGSFDASPHGLSSVDAMTPDQPGWLLVSGLGLAWLGLVRLAWLGYAAEARLHASRAAAAIPASRKRPGARASLALAAASSASALCLIGVLVAQTPRAPSLQVSAHNIGPAELRGARLPLRVACDREGCYVVDATLSTPTKYDPTQSLEQPLSTGPGNSYDTELPEENGPSDIGSPFVTKARTVWLTLPSSLIAALRSAARRYAVSETELAVEVESRYGGNVRRSAILQLEITRR
jgi:hypothetical protein